MSTLTRTVTAVAVLSLAALAPAAAQEDGLSDGVVAQVGEEPVMEAELRRRLTGAARSGQAGAVLVPPRFERCIADERRVLRQRGKRRSRRELRRTCRERYETLRNEILSFLIQAVWVRQEAAAQGLAVSPERVRRSLERQKRSAFLTERAYRRFLRDSGMTEDDLLGRVELDLLQQRLTRAAAATAPPVTDEEVDRYYATHRRRYRGKSRRATRRAIRRLLTAGRQQDAIVRFARDFEARYLAITVCAEGYLVPVCANSAG